jgi:very-short-patch-repair endonuclease
MKMYKEILEANGVDTSKLLFDPKFLPYNPYLKRFSKNLRNESELSEVLLWNKIKGKQMLGYTFNRQKPILNYIADFYCKPLNLVIEVDGSSHYNDAAIAKDKRRDFEMGLLGLKVLRISDDDVKKNISTVLSEIENFIILNYQ